MIFMGKLTISIAIFKFANCNKSPEAMGNDPIDQNPWISSSADVYWRTKHRLYEIHDLYNFITSYPLRSPFFTAPAKIEQ